MIFKHFIGEFKFKAEGIDSLLFINKIRKSHIKVHNLYTRNNEVYGTVYATKYKAISDLAEKCSMSVSVKEKKGLILKLKPYKKRFGIIAGVLFSVFFIFFLSNTTLRIRITGCSETLNEQVLSVLEKNGVEPGKYIPSMDFDKIERNIVATLKDVAWISIRNSGGTVIVDVTESTKKPDIILERLPSNIVSTKDAQITNVEVYSGQLQVLIGEGVKKGDLLVSGFIETKRGKTFAYHSNAKIYGKYEENIEFIQPFEEDVKIESEEEITKKYLNFFSIKIPLSFKDVPDEEFSYNERTTDLGFLFLDTPFGITRSYYRLYEIRHYTYDENMVRELLDNKVQKYELNFLDGCSIISKNIIEEVSEDNIKYTVKYLVEGDITKQNEILVKN